MENKVLFDGHIFNHGLEKISNFGREYHFRVVNVPISIGAHNELAWDLVVEREGQPDAMGQKTWTPVLGDDRFKILSQVAVIQSSQKLAEMEWRIMGLEEQRASMSRDELAGRSTTVTVPGAATGEPPQS